jgi:tetratricopeptide (TPR) repeat protein
VHRALQAVQEIGPDFTRLAERAAALEIGNPVNHQLLVQGYTEKVRGIIQRAGRGENVSQEFQQAVSSAIQRSQQAVQIHPREPSFWRLQGSLYELAIPFVQGAERPAFAAYEKAAVRDPQNPAVYTEWGRAGLVFADRVAALAGQAQAKEREELEQARKAALEEVAGVFRKAIEVKSDFAPAHFLLAQTLIRLGDLDQAIRSVENARQAAPSDIGVAFQLGLLYYQKNDLARAEAEFSRAVLLNDNYSNARYFLGLIYDRRGEREKAIIEFERIAALNPGNPEIKRILENLGAGKAALAGIVPPAEAPEKRKDTPVKEQEGRK